MHHHPPRCEPIYMRSTYHRSKKLLNLLSVVNPIITVVIDDDLLEQERQLNREKQSASAVERAKWFLFGREFNDD